MKYFQTKSIKSFITLSIVLGGISALLWSILAFLGLLFLLIAIVESFAIHNLNIIDSRLIYTFAFFSGGVLGTFGLWEAILSEVKKLSFLKKIIITIFIISGICSASLIPLNDFGTLFITRDFVLHLIAISLIGPIIIGFFQILKLWFPVNVASKNKTD